MFMIDYKQVNWWYWFATACVLTAGFAGYKSGFEMAVGLSVIQLMHFLVRERSLTAFTVQVRTVVLLYMLAAILDPTRILFGIAVAWHLGTVNFRILPDGAQRVVVPVESSHAIFNQPGYENLFLSRPVRGNIMQGLPPAPQAMVQPQRP